MKNNAFTKGLAGLGQGLAVAGELGYRHKLSTDLETLKAEILARRDEKLQSYLDQRNQADNTSRERIAGADNVARRDLNLEKRGWQQQDAEAKRRTDAEGLASKQDFELKKLDYEHRLQKDLEVFKSKHGTEKTTAMMQNIEYMTANGIAKDPKEAFSLLRTAIQKSDDDATLSLAGTLLRGSGYSGRDGKDRALQDARRMVKSLKGDDDDDADFEAGFRGQTGAPRAKGQDYTDEDLQFTAKKHGLTVDEVKRRLGIR